MPAPKHDVLSEPCRDRRHVIKSLAGAAAGASTSLLARPGSAALDGKLSGKEHPANVVQLLAKASTAHLVGGQYPRTAVWSYNGSVPGDTLSVQQGQRLVADFTNELPDASTVHWHGIRLPNAMDGVPELTQAPVLPGASFRYAFDLPDAGTYWYHPHLGTPEQVDRGLSGALLVHEREPTPVDRDIVWLIDDWRLKKDAQISDDFYRWHDISHDGRIGNTVTVNGRLDHRETVSPGDRIRLRLINAANARLFSLEFGDRPVWVIALDGHPLAVPRRLRSNEPVFFGPGQRVDLIIDIVGPSTAAIEVIDRLRPKRAFLLATLKPSGGSSRAMPSPHVVRSAPASLAANPVAVPSANDRQKLALVMDGGMMRPRIDASKVHGAGHHDTSKGLKAVWSINGWAHMSHGPEHAFAFTVARGQSLEIAWVNRSRFWHPMHLHGHAFRVFSRADKILDTPVWTDTTLIAPGETVLTEMVADNPGDWLIHCHILEHHAGGMGAQFRVT